MPYKDPETRRAKDRARSRRRYAKDPEWKREQDVRRLYGLPAQEYDLLLLTQGDSCAICEQKCPTKKRLAVDHDHDTGKVRALLCINCNKALGHMKDDPALLRAAAEYIEQHKQAGLREQASD